MDRKFIYIFITLGTLFVAGCATMDSFAGFLSGFSGTLPGDLGDAEVGGGLSVSAILAGVSMLANVYLAIRNGKKSKAISHIVENVERLPKEVKANYKEFAKDRMAEMERSSKLPNWTKKILRTVSGALVADAATIDSEIERAK